MNRSTLVRLQELAAIGFGTLHWSVPEPPATQAEIESAEASMRRRFPNDLREAFSFSRRWLWREQVYDAIIFQSPADIAAEFYEPEDPMARVQVSVSGSGRVKPYFYSSKRITFAFSDYHRFQVDEDPTVDGRPGQIVVVDLDIETIDVIADSLEVFLLRGIRALERQLAGGYPLDRM